MTQTIKSSGRKNKPTKQYKQSMREFLIAHGVAPSEAHVIAKVDNKDATGEELSESIKGYLKSGVKRG